MKLNNENYKGVAIRVVEKIINGKRAVEASAKLAGRIINGSGPTKAVAVDKVKSIINRII